MKALIIVTGRGLGGDAVVALNLIKSLEKLGVECEVGLDASAQGTLFEKKGYNWHKISIPQAGGHVATKATAFKAALKLIPATFKARKLIKKLDVDFVIGILGGGAIVGSLGAKFARTPCVSLISTPLDSMVCPKLNKSFILPEIDIFKEDTLPPNIEKAFYPLDENVGGGDAEIAFEKLSEDPKFDANKKTILFSSGSSIFKGTLDAANDVAEWDKYNVVLIGLPLEEEYSELISPKIIYLGFVNWINHLFTFSDLAVLTDDGVILEEALACEVPIVALIKVKWGRYHNMAGVFKGAILESNVEDIRDNIKLAFENYDSLKENALVYGVECMNTSDDLAKKILKEVK